MVINEFSLKALTGFYENELVNNFLSFWLPRCEDKENGGFLNCFDNKGEHLVSKNKYCWSQGRFVWIFSKLASTEAPIFSDAQRAEFLRLAKNGADFLEAHALIPGRNICSFLLDERGNPILVDGADRLDMSIYADCFVIAGMAMYALQSGEEGKYRFAKDLYLSVLDRVERNDFQTLPYPLSKSLRAHGIPMILSNISKDIHFAAKRFEPEYAGIAAENMWRFSSDTLSHFMDGGHLIHEVITADNRFFPQTLGDHINPGHSIEDAWFMLDSAEINGHSESFADIFQMVPRLMRAGMSSTAASCISPPSAAASLTGTTAALKPSPCPCSSAAGAISSGGRPPRRCTRRCAAMRSPVTRASWIGTRRFSTMPTAPSPIPTRI